MIRANILAAVAAIASAGVLGVTTAAEASAAVAYAPMQHGQGHGGGQPAHAQGGGQGQGGGKAQAQRGGPQQERGARAESRRNSGSSRGQQQERRASRAADNDRGTSQARAARPTTGRDASRGAERSIAARGNAAAARSGTTRTTGHMLAGAIGRAHRRGLAANALAGRSENGRVRITNQRGDVLFDMPDDRARDLGAWRLRRMGDRRPSGNAPAFCRSGQGHPVWGREWCLEKGFGLGSRAGTLWSRGTVDDVIFRRTDRTRLDRGGLIDVIGDIVLGRLALQAVSLGYDQPLMGMWLTPASGPRILQLQSGGYPVAEFVDLDRDNQVEVLYVVQPL